MNYGYWLYVCPNCDEIWCGGDPLLYQEPIDCACGEKDVKAGWVEEYDEN